MREFLYESTIFMWMMIRKSDWFLVFKNQEWQAYPNIS